MPELVYGPPCGPPPRNPFGTALGGPLGGMVGGAIAGQLGLRGLFQQQQQADLANLSNGGRLAYAALLQQVPNFAEKKRHRMVAEQYETDPLTAWLTFSRGDETLNEWLDREGL